MEDVEEQKSEEEKEGTRVAYREKSRAGPISERVVKPVALHTDEHRQMESRSARTLCAGGLRATGFSPPQTINYSTGGIFLTPMFEIKKSWNTMNSYSTSIKINFLTAGGGRKRRGASLY